MGLQNKKAILADAVNLFCSHFPDASRQTVATLEQHWREYISARKQLKKARNDKQALSRQIGEAKQKGQRTDSLVAEMKAASAQYKRINESLNTTGNTILELFSSEQGNPQSDDDKSSTTESQTPRYKTNTSDEANLTIALCENNTKDWNPYVTAHPAASIYHRLEWRELIQKTFGHPCYYLAARNPGGDIVGVLPMVRLKSRLFGDYMVSMPYFNYGGALADSAGIEQQLMQQAGKLAEKLATHHVEFRDNIAREGYPVRTEKVCMMLELPADVESLWQQFTPKLRAQIKRPQRENPAIKTGAEDLLDEFYYVFCRNMRDLGTPVYSKRFFRNILQHFPEESRIITVSLNSRPVSAAFLLGHQHMLEIPWASTLRETNHLSMNMLLYWEVLKFAVESGYTRFDFGRSTRNAGTFKFKRQWGAQPRQLHWHYWMQGNEALPALNPDNPKYAMAIALWKKLPLWIANTLGPGLVKNLP